MKRAVQRGVALWLLAGAPTGATELGDEPVFERIESVRPLAEAIVIDGSTADWAGVPEFPDPTGDAAGPASLDITSVSIAPLDDALLVRIETAEPAPDVFLNFWLDIDFRSEQFLDLQLGLDSTFDDLLWIYPEDAGATLVSWEHAELAVGGAVEARIPYDLLDPVLPLSMRGQLSGEFTRSWVRVTPFSVDLSGVVDYGSATASFRLVDTPYELDPELPPPGSEVVEIPSPLDGLWYVGQGAMTRGSHSGAWAYDFHIVDNALHPDDPFESPDNEDYFSFGEPFHAPVSGQVFSLETAQPDLDPRTFTPPATPPNFVFLEIEDDIGLLFSHAKQDTIPVAQGEVVADGASLGQVGHSGSTTWSHLHLDAQQIDHGFATVPIALEHVTVGLNPGAEDPWLRRIARWEIREGFLAANDPAPYFTATGVCPGAVTLTITNATDAGNVALIRGSGGGSSQVPAGSCAGTDLDLGAPALVSILSADASGTVDRAFNVPAGACSSSLQALDLASCEVSNALPLP